jgi:hypothetical protein
MAQNWGLTERNDEVLMPIAGGGKKGGFTERRIARRFCRSYRKYN